MVKAMIYLPVASVPRYRAGQNGVDLNIDEHLWLQDIVKRHIVGSRPERSGADFLIGRQVDYDMNVKMTE